MSTGDSLRVAQIVGLGVAVLQEKLSQTQLVGVVAALTGIVLIGV